VREHPISGRTKSIEWREQQLQQILKLCDEQSAAMQEAVFADFNRYGNIGSLFNNSLGCSASHMTVHDRMVLQKQVRN